MSPAPIFTAQSGAVMFEGRRVRDMTVMAIRSRMIRLAVDLNLPTDIAQKLWTIARNATDALELAREQRTQTA